jgi:hypothetical protein
MYGVNVLVRFWPALAINTHNHTHARMGKLAKQLALNLSALACQTRHLLCRLHTNTGYTRTQIHAHARLCT